jgi:flagellar basal-body rod protein FlgB
MRFQHNWHAHCIVSVATFATETNTVANDPLFGVHGTALALRSQRMGLIASNIANASTPGYKAKDIDFRAALDTAARPSMDLDAAIDAETKFRIPLQMSQDGNTVELATEQTAFAENAVAYQTTLSFLNGRIDTLKRALKGE